MSDNGAPAASSKPVNKPRPVALTIDDDPAIKVFPVHDKIGPDRASIARAISDGDELFRVKFNVVDGAGRPFATGDSKPTPRIAAGESFARISGPDATSCAGCHNEPAVGGSGDSAANAFVGAHFTDPATRSTTSDVTSERNTVTVFGSGLIEIAAAEMTRELQDQRRDGLLRAENSGARVDVSLIAKNVSFGSISIHPDGYIDYRKLAGIDHDLVVKPFGIKGVAISVREFTIAALNQHHGIQAYERFGWERTGIADFDGDGVENEFSLGQVTALTLFQAQLPPPKQQWSTDPAIRRREERGARLFDAIGCAECHRALPVSAPVFAEPNEYNRPGTLAAQHVKSRIEIDLSHHLDRSSDGKVYLLNAFTDLKRHDMCDEEVAFFCNERLKQDNVDLELFMTQKLWDIATSAPYCHRGDCSTLSEAILGHGGEARSARDSYTKLPTEDRRALLSFLGTLGRANSR